MIDMIYAVVVFLVIFALLCILLMSKVKILLEYENKTPRITVKLSFLRFHLNPERFSKGGKKKNASTKDANDDDDDNESVLVKLRKAKRRLREIRTAADTFFGFMRGKLQISGVFVQLDYGTGSAASTGIAYGAVWVLTGKVYRFLCKYIDVEFPKLELKPDFQNKLFRIYAEGIISFRPVHIINAAIRTYFHCRNKK